MRLLPIALACGLLSAHAQETLINLAPPATHPDDRTQVQVEALFSMAPPSGYLPVRVTATNQRKSDGTFSLNTRSETGNDSQMSSDFSFDVPAEKTTTRDLLVPVATAFSSSSYGSNRSHLQVRSAGSFGYEDGSLTCNFRPDGPAVILSEKLFTPNSGELDKEVNARRGGYGSFNFAARCEPARLPEDWRAYSGYDVLMLTDDDWTATTPGARASILQWVRLGGSLEIHRLTGSPTTFASLGIPADGARSDFGFGSVALDRTDTAFKLDAASVVKRLFGGSIPSVSREIESDYSSSWPLHDKFGKRSFSYGIFIVVLVAFGILVGPINLFVFAKSGQRHKLFITTPIISLATCALLIALIFLRDGVGGRGERIVLIEVRPEAGENRAYVLQEQISRTGVLFGSSFGLTEDAWISPVPIAPSPWARLTPGRSTDARYTARFGDEGLKITGDWFQSRSEQGQLIRAVVPTRGRIEIKGSGGAPVLVSTFDFPVSTIYYTDRSGGFWTATDLKAGTAVTCAPLTKPAFDAAILGERARLGPTHAKLLQSASARPDSFIAVTDDAPAIDTFEAIRWLDTHTILTGPVAR